MGWLATICHLWRCWVRFGGQAACIPIQLLLTAPVAETRYHLALVLSVVNNNNIYSTESLWWLKIMDLQFTREDTALYQFGVRIYQGSCRLTVDFTNFRPIPKLLARGLPLDVNRASAHVPPPGGRRSLSLPCLPGDAGSGSGAHAPCLHGTWSGFLRRRLGTPALGIPVRGFSPSPLPRRSGFAGSRILLLLAAGLPPRRDSQVGPGPPALAPPPWRRRGRVPVAEYASQPGAGRGPGCWPAALVGPRSDAGAGRGLSRHLGSKPSRFSCGETEAPARVTELMGASVACALPHYTSSFLPDTCHLLGHFSWPFFCRRAPPFRLSHACLPHSHGCTHNSQTASFPLFLSSSARCVWCRCTQLPEAGLYRMAAALGQACCALGKDPDLSLWPWGADILLGTGL